MTSATPGPDSIASLSGAPGPLVEIIEPALTVTRGKPAAMVRGQAQTSDVVGKVVAKGGLSTVMVNGQVIASGAPADVRADANVQAAYLGEEH